MPRSGFTLIELMVAMVITMIALGLLGRAFLEQQVTYERESEVIEMQSNSKIAMQLMSNEFMLAGFIPNGTNMPSTDVSGGAAEDIEEADANAFMVIGDIDDDGIIETVRYSWSGTAGDALKRETWAWNGSAWGVSSDAQELATAIQSLDINYYDGDNNELSTTPLSSSDRADVRKIKIDLVSQTDIPDPNLPRTSKLSSEIKPRNLGLVDNNTTSAASTSVYSSTTTSEATTAEATTLEATTEETTLEATTEATTLEATTEETTLEATTEATTSEETSSSTSTSTTTSTTTTVLLTGIKINVLNRCKASGNKYTFAEVQVTDASSNPLAGATVTWSLDSYLWSYTPTAADGYVGTSGAADCGSYDPYLRSPGTSTSLQNFTARATHPSYSDTATKSLP